MKKNISLFFLFFKMALCTYGGGYAILPIITKELVEKRGWLTEEELMDYYAIGQCTPGLIAINTATFTGSKRGGPIGGIVATLGFVAPSIILMSIISAILINFADIPIVQNAFFGIRVSVCVIILDTLIKLWKKSITDVISAAIFAFVIVVDLFLTVNPVIPVIISGVLGIIVNRIAFIRRGCDLVKHDGSDLASDDGGDLASDDGSDLASDDGGDLASDDGGDLASDDGGDLASDDGGDLASDDGGDLASDDGGDLASDDGGDLAGGGRV